MTDGNLQLLQLRVRDVLQSPDLGVHNNGDNNGLQLIGGHETEHHGLGRRSPCALVVHHRAVLFSYAQADVVAERTRLRRSVRRDNAHLQQLLQQVVLSANDGARLLLRQMSRRGGQGCRRNECTIRLLHKEGATDDRPQDWRPVVLNCTNQLVMHILNVRSRNIVEKAGILEPDQSGGRQGRSTDINLMMMPFICSCRNNK